MRFPDFEFSDAFDRLRGEMDRILSRIGPGNGSAGEPNWSPAIDLEETDDAYSLRCEVPGLGPEDIEVSVSDRTVTVSGTKTERRESKDATCHAWECRHGAFRRSLTLPSEIDADAITAECDQGVLHLRIPKGEHAGRRRIAVKSGRASVAPSRSSKTAALASS